MQRLGDMAAGTTVIKLEKAVTLKQISEFEAPEEYQVVFQQAALLSDKDIKIIKMVSKDLLVSVKEKITALDHWTDKSNTTAEISNLIRDTLWKNLPEVYTDTSIDTYRQHIFEYFYSRYKEVV